MAFEIIKRSRLRSQIERMLSDGMSPRKIAEWTQQQGEYINYGTIYAYKKSEFNFVRAALDEAELSAASSPLTTPDLFERGKQNILGDLAFCNQVIEIASRKIEELKDDSSKASQFKSFVETGLRAIDTKLKIAEEGIPNEPNTIINFNQLRVDLTRELGEIAELEVLETQGSCHD